MSPKTATRLTVAVSLAVLGMKYAAYAVTGSVSLYSDALESVVNVVAAVVALLAVRLAAQPPDENHPYGHTKAEYLSAVLEGALILFAAVEIVRAAWGRFLEPMALDGIGLGLAVSVAATGLNGLWAMYILRTGKRHRSPALVAEARHLGTDVATTVGVLAGIGLASATGWWILDPLLALAVAVNIVFVGVRVVRESVGALMDESVPDQEMAAIQETIRAHMDGAQEVHALRARHAGRLTFIDFHLVLAGDTSVAAAHSACDRLEAALLESIPASSVTIHVEPEHKGKGHGGVILLGSDVPHSFN